MLIKDWMTKDVITVSPDTSMMAVSKLLKNHDIRRVPVVDKDGRLIGIVTDRDIKEASPSKASCLDIHELYYLLSEIKVADIMTHNPYTINIDETVEKAAAAMLDKKIGGLPVVDDDHKVVGIITDTDIFKLLVNITVVYQDGVQMGFKLADTPGALKHLLNDLAQEGARILSILSSYDQPEPGFRHVYIRIHNLDDDVASRLKTILATKYNLLFWVKDNFEPKIT